MIRAPRIWYPSARPLVSAPGGPIPLRDIAKKFVVFVLGWRLSPEGVNQLVPIGTAFFVALPTTTPELGYFHYLVTAGHVVEGEQETFIRIRGKTETDWLQFPVSDWNHHATEDVAVASIPAGQFGEMDLDWSAILVPEFFIDHPESRSGTALTASLGDRVYFIGLLAEVPGMVERNVPMVRSGTIGALNERRVPIWVSKETKRYITAHLIDCRSFAGFSGSPCFAQFMDPHGEVTPFLGLMSGHFDMWADTRGTGDYSADFVGELKAPVNTGVGLCTPAEKITETLYLEDEVEKRERAEQVLRERREQETGATADKVGSEQGGEFERFEGLARQIVSVPKKEVDEQRRAEET